MISDFKRENRLTLQMKDGRKRQERKRRRLALSGILFLGVFVLICFSAMPSKSPQPSGDRIGSFSPPSKEDQLLEVQHQTLEGKIKEGSTFYQSLTEQKVPPQWIELIISKLRPYINFRRIKGGTFQLIKDWKGELVKFVYEVDPTEIYEVEKGSKGYTVQKKEVPLDIYLVKVVGEIRSSLFEAMDAAGEQDQLTIFFAEILAWEVDFYKDVREGNRFKVVVEKVYKGDQFIKYGSIHALEYQGEDHIVRGIEYQGHYYHENGTSLRKAFLKAPLRFNRISSRFSRARRHPILGGTFPHYGVDYGAPPGTPVWAVADGVVVFRGWNGGFGKQVTLRHMNGYRTYYGHLSRYGPGIKIGTRVKQKQIIGFVGSTGLSTGPHLDYRLTKDGRFRNPMKENFPAGVPIGKGETEIFQKKRDEMVGWLQGDTPLQQPKPSLPFVRVTEE